MGEDKEENDLLIQYGFPEDIWYGLNLVLNWSYVPVSLSTRLHYSTAPLAPLLLLSM